MKKANKTTVALSEETKEQLTNLGKKGESFDSIIQRVIKNSESLCKPNQKDDVVEEEQ
jgi:hypothetical protein